ncbi:MAG: NAD(P)/FAD-dependent oxidoreductase [Eubacteriales bacterium]|nr:NAD(P)/FAD-dependent oxidoreductase [Eubacteriales bacterium]
MAEKKHVIVVGGGAAGLVAAISAKRQGADVTILERNTRVGKKILATGNGRCNYTNVNADITHYYGKNPGFAANALTEFSKSDTISFFQELGIEHKVEELGKVFPMSDQASSFLDVFLYELNELGIQVMCEARVKSISKKSGEFIVETNNGDVYKGDSVIIATGGKALPSSGSEGDGYELAKSLGHRVTDIFPSIVQLMLEGGFFKRIDGVKIVGTAEVVYGGKTIVKDRGDILFTNYGVSGPPVLQVSRMAGELLNEQGELLNEQKEVYLKIRIIDTMSKDELCAIMERRFNQSRQKTVEQSMIGFINKRLIPVLLEAAGIEPKRSVAELNKKERESIVNILAAWEIKIRGTKGWTSAQATAGGVETDDIDASTMESKLVKGLYFAGEVIDIDGQCGGYNLQWAWSSGFVAGQNAAK